MWLRAAVSGAEPLAERGVDQTPRSTVSWDPSALYAVWNTNLASLSEAQEEGQDPGAYMAVKGRRDRPSWDRVEAAGDCAHGQRLDHAHVRPIGGRSGIWCLPWSSCPSIC